MAGDGVLREPAPNPVEPRAGAGPDLFRGLVTVLVSRVAVLAIALVSGVLVARELGPAGRGVLATLLVYPTLLVSLSELGIRQSVAYHLGGNEHADEEVVSAMLSLLVLGSLVSVIACAAVYTLLDNPLFSLPLVLLALAVIPVRLAVSYSEGVLLGKGAIGHFAHAKWMSEGLYFLAVASLALLGRLSVAAAVAAYFCASAVMAVYMLALVRGYARLRPRFHARLVGRMLLLGGGYAVTLFVMQLNYRIDLVILERLRSAAEIGQYSVGVSVAELLWQIPTALGAVVFSHSATSRGSKELTRQVAKLVRLSLIVTAVAGALLWWSSDFLIPAVYGAEFAGSVSILRILTPGIMALAIFKILHTNLAGEGRPYVALTVMVPAVAANIVLNLLWVPRHGAAGSAAASAVSYTLATAAFVVVYAASVKLPLGEMWRYRRSDFDVVARLRTALSSRAT